MPGSEVEAKFTSSETIKVWIDDDGRQCIILVPAWSWIAYACKRSLNEKTPVSFQFDTYTWRGTAVAILPHWAGKVIIDLRSVFQEASSQPAS